MIVYSLFDSTNPAAEKHLFSSNKLEDVYLKLKAILIDTINYEEFALQYKHKISGQFEYNSKTNSKKATIIISRNT